MLNHSIRRLTEIDWKLEKSIIDLNDIPQKKVLVVRSRTKYDKKLQEKKKNHPRHETNLASLSCFALLSCSCCPIDELHIYLSIYA